MYRVEQNHGKTLYFYNSIFLRNDVTIFKIKILVDTFATIVFILGYSKICYISIGLKKVWKLQKYRKIRIFKEIKIVGDPMRKIWTLPYKVKSIF